jgi:hypothetical protein
MADLAGHAAAPMQQAPIDDHAAADAGADGDIDHVPQAAPGAEAPLGQRRDIGVIIDADRQAEPLGCQRREGHVVPAAQPWRMSHHAGRGIQRAGRADADADDAVLPRDLPDERRHLPDDRIGAIHRRRLRARMGEDPALGRDDRRP